MNRITECKQLNQCINSDFLLLFFYLYKNWGHEKFSGWALKKIFRCKNSLGFLNCSNTNAISQLVNFSFHSLSYQISLVIHAGIWLRCHKLYVNKVSIESIIWIFSLYIPKSLIHNLSVTGRQRNALIVLSKLAWPRIPWNDPQRQISFN